MRIYETSERSSLHTKDVLFFLIWIPVTQSRIYCRAGHYLDLDIVGSFSHKNMLCLGRLSVMSEVEGA